MLSLSLDRLLDRLDRVLELLLGQGRLLLQLPIAPPLLL